ncbi:MAG: hypothetical protein ABJ275_00545 [Maricaulaceae bacterium]
MSYQSNIITAPMKNRAHIKALYPSLKTLLAFVCGALVPIVALVLSVLISLGLGVLGAEDWDGFAQRIDFGKMIAFYLSLLFGLWLGVGVLRQTSNRLRRAQAYGLALILTLWLVFL